MSAIQQMIVGSGQSPTLLEAITSAGLTSNLVLCLDAGDPASYTSGQSWLDRSGGGYDFFLGANGSSQASDPTFNNVGRPSYWSFDGGDYFTYDTTNETWMQNIHKNNAAITLLIGFKPSGAGPGLDPNNHIATASDTETGFKFETHDGGSGLTTSFVVRNAGAVVLSKTGTTVLSSDTNHVVAVSLNEATGASGGFLWLDGSYNKTGGPATDLFDSTYSSPAAGNATNTMQLSALGSGNSPNASGSRLLFCAAWSTALTKANIDSIWNIIRARVGI